jgi:uncharacterized DUF497 family protein
MEAWEYTFLIRILNNVDKIGSKNYNKSMTDKHYISLQGTYSGVFLSFPCDSFGVILLYNSGGSQWPLNIYLWLARELSILQWKLILLPFSRLQLLNLRRGFKLIINDIIWKQQFVEKIYLKHRVSIDEVEEVLGSDPFVCKVARGHIDHENICAAYAQIHNGRYLIVFFINKKGNRALPISARDMDNKERRYYENQKKSKKRY